MCSTLKIIISGSFFLRASATQSFHVEPFQMRFLSPEMRECWREDLNMFVDLSANPLAELGSGTDSVGLLYPSVWCGSNQYSSQLVSPYADKGVDWLSLLCRCLVR